MLLPGPALPRDEARRDRTVSQGIGAWNEDLTTLISPWPAYRRELGLLGHDLIFRVADDGATL
jgi:hypothetical protein